VKVVRDFFSWQLHNLHSTSLLFVEILLDYNQRRLFMWVGSISVR